MISIIKTTMKLLFRNVVFWVFLIFTPILSTLVLRLEVENLGAYEVVGAEEIIEMDKTDEKVAYFGGKGKYVIKVYDASNTELSEYMLNSLSESGMITVVRIKTKDMTKDQVEKEMHFNGYDDRMGAALYLDKDFDKVILDGDSEKAMTVYILSDDERSKILENEIKMCMGRINMAKQMGGQNDIIANLNKISESIPDKNVVLLDGKNSRNLTNVQLDQKALMGYAFAFMTLGFVFGGVLIAYTVINEQKNMVLTRVKLSQLTDSKYFAAKFICGAIVSFMITGVTSIAALSVDSEKMGMSRIGFFIMIFFLGLIFCSISLMIGILFADVMSATVAAFVVWVLSSLLSGLYFPLDSASKAIKSMSYMMPSKWFLDVTEMLMLKDSNVYFMILCITIAYLIVTLGLGSIGVKIKKNE